MKLQEKEAQKHTGNLLRMNLQLKMPVNSRPKALYIIGQRRAFCGQRMSLAVRGKKLLTQTYLCNIRNSDRKKMQSI